MKKFVASAFVCASVASAAQGAVLMNEPFTYSDGPLSTSSGGAWSSHSGTDAGTTQLAVAGNQILINQNDTGSGRADLSRAFNGGASFDPATDNTTVIYTSFTANFAALPVNGDSEGSYFAHIKGSAANEFIARVGANTNGAAAGKFRLAIANKTWSAAGSIELAQDLDLNTTYTVVTRFDLSTDQATLWVNPVSEASAGVTATDAVSYAASPNVINAYAFRQGVSGTGAPGDINIDNLIIGTSFAEVVPEPTSLALLGLGGIGLLARRRRA